MQPATMPHPLQFDAANRLPPPPAAIASVFQRPEVRDTAFRDSTVALGGKTYVGCRFENCTLEITELDFDLLRCTIDDATQVQYRASVRDIARHFDPYFPWANRHAAAFFVLLAGHDGQMPIWFIGKEF